ncbi:MAG: flavin reductase family protein [Rhodospirillales bacterium]|nr:flavin reductase family protein [Rhodospirillales bacterium]
MADDLRRRRRLQYRLGDSHLLLERAVSVRALPLPKVYQLIEPGPVVLLTTVRKGRANVMTMSWHMMVEFEPPLIACVVSGANYSFDALCRTKECVVAIPAASLAAKVVKVGNSSGRDGDKFKACGLTPVPAERVAAPLIKECFANLECRVADARMVRRYNLFILEVLKAWVDPAKKHPKTIHHHGYGRFVLDGRTVTLRSRMR